MHVSAERNLLLYTYYNNRINAIDMNKEYLDAKEIKIFNYRDTLDINYEN